MTPPPRRIPRPQHLENILASPARKAAGDLMQLIGALDIHSFEGGGEYRSVATLDAAAGLGKKLREKFFIQAGITDASTPKAQQKAWQRWKKECPDEYNLDLMLPPEYGNTHKELMSTLKAFRNGHIAHGSSALKKALDDFHSQIKEAIEQQHWRGGDSTPYYDTYDNWRDALHSTVADAISTGLFVDGNPIGPVKQGHHTR